MSFITSRKQLKQQRRKQQQQQQKHVHQRIIGSVYNKTRGVIFQRPKIQ